MGGEPSLPYRTLDDFDFKGKRTLVRVDMNCPVEPETGRITDLTRIQAHVETLRELADRGARVVVLSHQGRRGKPDFIHLDQHAEALGRLLGRAVRFVADIAGEEALQAIRELNEGGLLVLDNVRFMEEEAVERSPEEHAKVGFVRALAATADIFVNDAFATAHRSHASVVGFTPLLPSAIGRVMERELRALARVVDQAEHPCVYVVGGAKPEEKVPIIRNVLERGAADRVLTGGVTGQIFLAARGYDLGATKRLLEEQGWLEYVEVAEAIIKEFGERVVTPIDLAVEEDGRRVEIELDRLPAREEIKDIGTRTIGQYAEVLKNARAAVMNGPLGVFEEEGFEKGTLEVLRALADSRAFSLVGGGHIVGAANSYGLADRISHISTAGGALMRYLAGRPLPGLEALKAAAARA